MKFSRASYSPGKRLSCSVLALLLATSLLLQLGPTVAAADLAEPEITTEVSTEGAESILVSSGPHKLITTETALPPAGGSYPTYPDALASLSAAESFSVAVNFQTPVGGRPTEGTVFSISNSGASQSYFRLYSHTNKLYYELVGNTGTILSDSFTIPFDNSTPYIYDVAFVANSADKSFKLFLNGALAETKTLTTTYQSLNALQGLDTVCVGDTVYTGYSNYPFTGTIYDLTAYDRPLTDDEAIKITTPFDPTPAVEITEKTELPDGTGGYPSYPEAVTKLAAASDLTVLCNFRATPPSASVTPPPPENTIFSISDSSADNAYFRLYTLADKLHYEFVNGAEHLEDSEGAAIRFDGDTPLYNAIAFTANSTDYTFKLFVNGELLKEVQLDESTYRMLNDLTDPDTVSVGETVYTGSERFPFTGLISSLRVCDYAVSDKDAVSYTKRFDPDAPLVLLDGPANLPLDGYTVYPDAVDGLSKAKDFTLTAQFMQTSVGIGPLLSIINSDMNIPYFQLYADGTSLGYDMMGVPGGNFTADVEGLRANGANTVALVANSSDYTYKLFLNGNLAHTKELTADTYRMFYSLNGLDKVTLGQIIAGSVVNSFVGTITELAAYDYALTDEEMLTYTDQTPGSLPVPPNMATQPFYAYDNTGSGYFRIPALLTLNNGDIMAAIDARYSGTGDSPSNLDTAVNFKRDGADEWEDARVINSFLDQANAGGWWQYSASFIDPQMVQLPADSTHPDRILLLVDAYPYGAGSGTEKEQSVNGMVEVDGKSYLALTQYGRTAWGDDLFEYYLKPNPAPSGEGDKYLVCARIADADDYSNYTTDGKFNLYIDGELQTTAQYGATPTQVPLNLFYKESPLKPFPTSYLYLTHSDDNGETWSDPQIIGNDQRDERHGNFMGDGPGRGHVVQNGEYKGRVMFTIYDMGVDDASTPGSRNNERASVVYSDDGGDTWALGQRVVMATSNSPGKASESQIVELPDGTLRMYARSSTEYIGYTDSSDGGVTWAPAVKDLGLKYMQPGGGCQISVINCSTLIDGKPVLILSCPSVNRRKNGVIHIGLINEDTTKPNSMERYTVDWQYLYKVNTGLFSYSCLTELADGKIGLLYENDCESTVPGANPVYVEYTLEELMRDEGSDLPRLSLVGAAEQGQSYTVTLPLTSKVMDSMSDLEHSTLKVTYPETDLPDGTLTFLSKTDTTLVYRGTWPAGRNGATYAYQISVPANIPVVTLEGKLNHTLYVPLTGTVSPPAQSSVRSYTVTAAASEGGSITPASKRVALGGQCTFTMTAEDGYVLSALLLDESEVAFAAGKDNWTYTITNVRADHSLRAVFSPASDNPEASALQDIGGHWAEDAIKALVSAGLMNGVGASQFNPDGMASRAMVATILHRLAGTPGVTADAGFSDVVSGSWYADAVSWAADKNIVSGVGGDSFAPGRNITRQELATLFYQFTLLSDPKASADEKCLDAFPDSGDIADWAQVSMAWCVENGILAGKPQGILDPGGMATRGELATIILRIQPLHKS